MSDYRSRRRDEAVADDYLADHLACRKCRAMTHRDELGTYGGQCRQCYEAWCAEANPRWMPSRPLTDAERAKLRQRIRTGLRAMVAQRQNPRAWIGRLQDRIANGERLGEFQRKALQEVEGGMVAGGEDAK
jgi:hypothetical protein